MQIIKKHILDGWLLSWFFEKAFLLQVKKLSFSFFFVFLFVVISLLLTTFNLVSKAFCYILTPFWPSKYENAHENQAKSMLQNSA